MEHCAGIIVPFTFIPYAYKIFEELKILLTFVWARWLAWFVHVNDRENNECNARPKADSIHRSQENPDLILLQHCS